MGAAASIEIVDAEKYLDLLEYHQLSTTASVYERMRSFCDLVAHHNPISSEWHSMGFDEKYAVLLKIENGEGFTTLSSETFDENYPIAKIASIDFKKFNKPLSVELRDSTNEIVAKLGCNNANVLSLDLSENDELTTVCIANKSNLNRISLASCPSLTTIDLSACGAALLVLQLSFVDLSSINVAAVLAPLVNLRTLDVDNSSLTCVAGLSCLKASLMTLDLSSNEIADVCDLFGFVKLVSLDLRENENLKSYREKVLRGIRTLTKLDNLNVNKQLATNEELANLKDDVERNNSGGNLSIAAMKEFDSALKGEIDNVVVS